MAVNLTASSANSSGSPELIRSPRDREYVKIVGASASANDTSNAYTSTLPTPVGVVGGAFTASISGRAITFTALNALGDSTVYVEVIGAL